MAPTTYQKLQPFTQLTQEQYKELKETTQKETKITYKKIFNLTTQAYEPLTIIGILPDGVTSETIAHHIDPTLTPELLEYINTEEALTYFPEATTTAHLTTILKYAFAGVENSKKVSRPANKKYPKALFTHPWCEETVKAGYEKFLHEIATEKHIETLKNNVNPRLRQRKTAPEKVTLHLGPTNSGKTFHAIEAMMEKFHKNNHAKVVYAGPLRMLAFEVYEKLAVRLGENNVGLVTGEHSINPDAPVLACTIECAPDAGDLIVVDECHWAMDDDRGKNWTNVLQGYEYPEFILLGPVECAPHMRFLMADAEVIEQHEHQRIVPVVVDRNAKGKVRKYTANNVPKRSAVVAFSKKAVIALADDIARESGLKTAALYGRMPLQNRQDIVDRFTSGEIDVVVTTDVIGHGINLPIDYVLFAETQKFDGSQVRSLEKWELAQIAGRAGRFGLSECGYVAGLSTKWGSINHTLISQGVDASMGETKTELAKMRCVAYPNLRQLGLVDDSDIMYLTEIMKHWKIVCSQMLRSDRELSKFVTVSSMQVPLMLAKRILNEFGSESGLTLEQMWQVINGPFDADSDVVSAVVPFLVLGDCSGLLELWAEVVQWSQVPSVIESQYRLLSELRAVGLMFGDGGIEGVASVEDFNECESRLASLYREHSDKEVFGRCVSCGAKTSAPWFDKCDNCHFSYRRYEYHDDFFYGGFHRYEVTEEEREERNEISRNWSRARSAACRDVSPWFSVGQEVRVNYRGREYSGEVTKVNKVTVKVTFALKDGQVREENMYAVYLAKDNGMHDRLAEVASVKAFEEMERPERIW